MQIKIKCIECQKVYGLDVDDTGYDAWREGMLIQKALPEMSKDDRELLISSICGTCFDAIFASEGE